MKTFINIPILATLVLMTSCATLAPLSTEERDEIETVYIVNNLGSQLHYVKIGTTVFGNKESHIENEDLLSNLYDSVKAELEARGYEFRDSLDTSDIGLSVNKGTTYNYPSGRGVHGAGFFVHIVLGINHGIQVESEIVFKLIDPETGNERYSKSIEKFKMTKIKKNANEWEDFSEAEKKDLLAELEEQLKNVAAEAIDKIGL